ncbi:putative diguanylate cyclase DgcE [Frankliniella fusca]|uniref:Diguanylate cyclase DgcE n=1 Tax=Frankliniella fusca TaxID=407009 RepID=A0AAE1GZ37_9NEOP|nr:putative diguanylate cyclase DgcE [Frankliniella fusca]
MPPHVHPLWRVWDAAIYVNRSLLIDPSNHTSMQRFSPFFLRLRPQVPRSMREPFLVCVLQHNLMSYLLMHCMHFTAVRWMCRSCEKLEQFGYNELETVCMSRF